MTIPEIADVQCMRVARPLPLRASLHCTPSSRLSRYARPAPVASEIAGPAPKRHPLTHGVTALLRTM
jgi:hypothetical protein